MFRSGGDRGADVETLRGTTGADWEGRAVLARDQGGVICGCFGGGGDEDRLLLIKGPFCFVFGDVTDSAPKVRYCDNAARPPHLSDCNLAILSMLTNSPLHQMRPLNSDNFQ